MSIHLVAATLLGFILMTGAAADEPPFAERARAFEYDAKAPLDLQERSVETVDAVEVHDVTYASPMGGRVPAYLLVAPGTDGARDSSSCTGGRGIAASSWPREWRRPARARPVS